MKSLPAPGQAFLLAVILMLAGCRGGDYDLRFRPPHNSDYRLVFTNQGNVEITLAGAPLKTVMNTTMACDMHFDSTASGNWNVGFRYTDYAMGQEVNGRRIALDSLGTDSTQDQKEILDLLKQMTFKGTISPLGRVESRTNIDSLWKQMEGQLGFLPDPMKTQLATSMRPLINNDIFSGMLEQCFRIFPNRKVSVGDTWTSEIRMKSMFSMVIDNQFTLLSVKDGVAEIALSSNIVNGDSHVAMPGLAMVGSPSLSGPQANKGFDLMGIKMEANFTGSQEGTMYVDMGTGMMVNSKIRQDLSGVFKLNSMEMPMKLKMNIGYRTGKLDASNPG